jgi:hypothetical protein
LALQLSDKTLLVCGARFVAHFAANRQRAAGGNMKFAITLLFIALVFPSASNAQFIHNFEASGGWAHVTGNNGLDGYNLGAGVWLAKRVSLVFNFDDTHDISSLTAFTLTNGLITTKSSMEDYMIGPRVFLNPRGVKILHTLQPFVEVEIGGAHLHSELSQVGAATQTASDNAGAWLLGGGGDFVLSKHWVGLLNLDLFRTHFVDAGQSRLRIMFGVAYSFGSRKIE